MSPQGAITIHPATPDRWSDLVDLFERPGPRGGTPITSNCWCMFWRQRTGDGGKNKKAMKGLVSDGMEPGLIAYDDDVPVGWVSVAPRAEFGQLMRSRSYRPREEEDGIWSIVCFYVDRQAKKQGVREALLEAAVDHAERGGARAIEAYPHVDGDYMGSHAAFERKGFVQVREAGKRVVMRYEAST